MCVCELNQKRNKSTPRNSICLTIRGDLCGWAISLRLSWGLCRYFTRSMESYFGRSMWMARMEKPEGIIKLEKSWSSIITNCMNKLWFFKDWLLRDSWWTEYLIIRFWHVNDNLWSKNPLEETSEGASFSYTSLCNLPLSLSLSLSLWFCLARLDRRFGRTYEN